LGLVATGGGLFSGLVLRWVAWAPRPGLALDSLDLERSLENFSSPGKLVAGVTGAFVLGLVFWLAGAVAEGGLIVAVRARTAESFTLSRAVRAGLSLLGRFVGIDTLLFLPLFLLALALIVVGFAGLGGLVVVATRPGAQLADLLLVVGVSTVISTPIFLLMLGAAMAIMVLRALAFRAAAVEEMNSPGSIRRAWRLLRANFFSVGGLALVLWAIRSLVGTPLRMVAMLLAGFGWALTWSSLEPGPNELSLLLALGSVLLALFTWLVNGLLNVYGSTSWTLAYEKWAIDSNERG
jgi:hypothetical protein